MPEISKIAEAQASTAIPGQVNTWLKIGADETVTLTIGASEMGQGSFSGLAQILAEELMVSYSKVVTLQGSPSLENPQPVGSSLNTVGSGITRNNFWKLRDAGAAAREMLVSAAMKLQMDSVRGNYSVALGVVKHALSGNTWTFGKLADAASALTPPSNVPLVPDSQFQLIDKTQARFDIPSNTDRSAKYGLDVTSKGNALCGSEARPLVRLHAGRHTRCSAWLPGGSP